MTVVQLDGGESITNSEITDSIGILYPGERMDVIIYWPDEEQENESYLVIALDDELVLVVPFLEPPTADTQHLGTFVRITLHSHQPSHL